MCNTLHILYKILGLSISFLLLLPLSSVSFADDTILSTTAIQSMTSSQLLNRLDSNNEKLGQILTEQSKNSQTAVQQSTVSAQAYQTLKTQLTQAQQQIVTLKTQNQKTLDSLNQAQASSKKTEKLLENSKKEIKKLQTKRISIGAGISNQSINYIVGYHFTGTDFNLIATFGDDNGVYVLYNIL